MAGAKAGESDLEAMLRTAGWEPLPAEKTADATVRRYRKRDLRGSLRAAGHQGNCERSFVFDLIAPL